jgi:hypothetical protein
MSREKSDVTRGDCLSSRREFLAGFADVGLVGRADNEPAWAVETSDWSGLPARPEERPLDFNALANDFDAWAMDPAHGLKTIAKDGRQVV